jgi:hypothetical protein
VRCIVKGCHGIVLEGFDYAGSAGTRNAPTLWAIINAAKAHSPRNTPILRWMILSSLKS